MGLHSRGVDEHLRGWSASRGQSLEDIDPDALGGPSDEAIVERLARTVGLRRVDPSTAGPQDMHDAADHPAIINPRLAACVGWQQRRETCELILGQPEMIAIHLCGLPLETVNHETAANGIPLMGPDPKT